jgi:DNA-binding NarL/FixJ family response regulator
VEVVVVTSFGKAARVHAALAAGAAGYVLKGKQAALWAVREGPATL